MAKLKVISVFDMVLMQVFMHDVPAVEQHMFLRTSALDCTGHMQHTIAIGF